MAFEGRCQTLICFYDEAHIAGFGMAGCIFLKKNKKNMFLHFTWRQMNINGLRGKKTGRLSPSLPVVDTFLNTVEK